MKIGVSNDCQCSDHEVDEIESIDSQQSMTNFDDLSVDSAELNANESDDVDISVDIFY